MKKESNIKQDNECIICFYQINNNKDKIIFDCKHTYHLNCILNWKLKINKIICPICENNTDYVIIEKENNNLFINQKEYNQSNDLLNNNNIGDILKNNRTKIKKKKKECCIIL